METNILQESKNKHLLHKRKLKSYEKLQTHSIAKRENAIRAAAAIHTAIIAFDGKLFSSLSVPISIATVIIGNV